MQEWLQQPESISLTTDKKEGADTFAVWNTDGYMSPKPAVASMPTGYFWKDMQHLDLFEIRNKSGNPVCKTGNAKLPDGGEVYQYTSGTTEISRRDTPGDRQYDIRLQCRNPGRIPEKLTLLLGAHLQDFFQLMPNLKYAPMLTMWQQAHLKDNGIDFDAKPCHINGPDGHTDQNHVGTEITLEKPLQPAGTSSLKIHSPFQTSLNITVPPHGSVPLHLTLRSYDDAYRQEPLPHFDKAVWRSGMINFRNIQTDSTHAAMSQILKTSDSDIRSFLVPIPAGDRTDFVPGAGSPRFLTLFGRDSLITSWQWLAVQPQLARDTLDTLVYYQGKHFHPLNREQPGKIPHELRQGDLSRLNIALFHGTIDATPLFIMLLGNYIR